MKDKPADSSSTASIQHDPKSKDKPKPQQITYPYQNQLKRLLNPTWSALLLSVTALTVAAEFINNPKDFFYPCNYENSISLNDTLKLKSHLNEKQGLIKTYQSHLSTTPDITVAENEKYKSMLKNAIEESTKLKQEYQNQKSQWKDCFIQNRDNFGRKVKTSQFIFSIIGLSLFVYQIFKFIQYTSKLKQMNLTKKQKELYVKDWSGLSGFKIYLFFNCLLFTLFICIFKISLWKIYPTEVPYFD